jgi:hypothetical protein
LTALTVMLVFAASASAQGKRFWGVHLAEPATERDLRTMERAGIGIAKFTASWRGLEAREPTRNPWTGDRVRHYDWAGLDGRVARFATGDVEIQFGLYGSPPWIGSSQATSPMRTAEGRQGWRDFVAAVMKRYGRGGQFWKERPYLPPKPVTSVQIWNEQNSSTLFRPRADPKEYARMVRLAASEIRAHDPWTRILLGGMFGTPGSEHSYTAWRFLRELYKVPGITNHFDGVAIHPYGRSIRAIRYQVDRIRKRMNRSGDRRTPLHVTEIGWASTRGPSIFHRGNPKGQRRMLARSFRFLLDNKRKLNLRSIYWHTWKDQRNPRKACSACGSMGLVRPDLSIKPAFKAYRQIARR